jgi:hypothetical protein
VIFRMDYHGIRKIFLLVLCICASVTHSHEVVKSVCKAKTPAAGSICCACDRKKPCCAFQNRSPLSDLFPGLLNWDQKDPGCSADECGCQGYCCKVLSTLVFLPMSISWDPSRGGSHAGLGAIFPFPQLDLTRAIFHPPRV